MANDAGGTPKKLSTKDILAAARAQAASKKSGEEAEGSPADAASPEDAPAADAPVASKPATPAEKPKSTKDVLAAARASAAGGGAKPGSTKDILAAARAQAGGGAPADKPKSTKDILAAARSAAGKGDTGEAPAAAASPKAAAAPKVASTGKKPSVQEMLAAVRGEKSSEPAAAQEKPSLPPAPVRPSPKPAKSAKAGAGAQVSRRAAVVALLTSPFILAWVMFTGAAGTAGLAVLRFMLPNVLTEPPSRFKVGPPEDFDLGTVSTKFKASNGIWIVHTDKYKGENLIYALASVCTHLGCTPSWLEGEQKFKCPCHGSGFYINGINFEGPAPRPLERVGIRLAEDGMLEVDKSLKFQEEMGQWNDPASFYPIA